MVSREQLRVGQLIEIKPWDPRFGSFPKIKVGERYKVRLLKGECRESDINIFHVHGNSNGVYNIPLEAVKIIEVYYEIY